MALWSLASLPEGYTCIISEYPPASWRLQLVKKGFSLWPPALKREVANPSKAAETLRRARAAFQRNDIDAALSLANAARDQYEDTRETEALGHAYDLLGDVLMQMGQFEEAARSYEQAAHWFKLPLNDAETFVKLAEVNHYEGHLDKALAAYRQASQLYDRLGESQEALLVICRIGYILYQQQKWEEAEKTYRTALQRAEGEGLQEIVENNLLDIANSLTQQGRSNEARTILQQIAARAREEHNQGLLADALHSLAYTYAQSNQRLRASELYLESLELKQGLRNRLRVADTLFELGVNENELGHREVARNRLEQAAAIYQELGVQEQLQITHSWLEQMKNR